MQRLTAFSIFLIVLTFGLTITAENKPLQGRTLAITTVINYPYVALLSSMSDIEKNGSNRVSHGPYGGFAVEVIDEVSKILGFNYELILAPEGAYGMINSTGHWTGMIGEVFYGRAHAAISDLTITSQREKVVDFTMPFKMSGITVLSKKPTSTTAFLWNPIMVWIYFILIFVGLTYLLMKRSQGCPGMIAGPKSTSDDKPRCSTRLFTYSWMLFVLLMIVMSLGCFAIYLRSSTKMINSIESLAKQKEVKYGVMARGSTEAFLRESGVPLYKRMYNEMPEQNFVYTYESGVERVKKGNYAIFMEADKVKLLTQRECDLYQIGGIIASKGFGIAVQQGSPLKELLNAAVLQLQERGTLDELRSFWWRNPGICHSGEVIYHGPSSFWTVYGYVRCIAGLSGLVFIAAALVELLLFAKQIFTSTK